MLENERLVRALYAATEGAQVDPNQLAAMFADDGYMRDMASGTEFCGTAIGEPILGLLNAFPDLHRELLRVYAAADVVVIELAMRGIDACGSDRERQPRRRHQAEMEHHHGDSGRGA